MVIGNGLIASAFMKDYRKDDRFVIFASGVSNSSETDDYIFEKEEVVLRETIDDNSDKHLVYFTSFHYANIKKYVKHKIHMEVIIRNAGINYTILKLPQVIGMGGNINNLFNYLIFNIRNDNVVNVYNNTFRSLIDVEDIKRIVDIAVDLPVKYIIFPYIEKLLVRDIITLIAKALNVDPKISFVESEVFDFPQRNVVADYILQKLNLIQEGYTKRIINKYLGCKN